MTILQRTLFGDAPDPEADPEAVARDAALDLFECTRASLIARAKEIAIEISRREGHVTSVMVMKVLKEEAKGNRALAKELANSDPRWLGAVFRKGTGWQRVDWTDSGSHKRPVSVWTRIT